jgi:hypothetical protein
MRIAAIDDAERLRCLFMNALLLTLVVLVCPWFLEPPLNREIQRRRKRYLSPASFTLQSHLELH